MLSKDALLLKYSTARLARERWLAIVLIQMSSQVAFFKEHLLAEGAGLRAAVN